MAHLWKFSIFSGLKTAERESTDKEAIRAEIQRLSQSLAVMEMYRTMARLTKIKQALERVDPAVVMVSA